MKFAIAMFTLFAMTCLGADEAPRYSRADGYADAPQATGLPESPAAMSRANPGLYDDYAGEMFGEGAFHMLAPDQPLPVFAHADWMERASDQVPLRVVALHRSYAAGVDVFQLASRLGADLRGVPMAFATAPAPPRGERITELTVARLRELLAEPVDVIMVNNLLGALPVEAQSLILEKVRAGTGLVSTSPLPAEGPLVEALGLANPGAKPDGVYRHFGATRTQGSWLTGGVLFDLFPGRDVSKLKQWTDYDPRYANVLEYQLRADSDAAVQASLDGRPLVITGTIGRGRYVHFAWEGNRWDGGYLPMHSDVDDMHALANAAHYEEQTYSLLGKAVVQVASGLPAPSVVCEWPDGLVSNVVRLHNLAAAEATVRVRVTLRDAVTWEVLDEQTTRLTLPPESVVPAPSPSVPTPVVFGPAGQRPALLEYSVRDAAGRPLDWGNTRIAPVAAEPLSALRAEVVYPGQDIQIDLRTAVAVTWAARDTWGRTVATGQLPADAAAGAIPRSIRFTPDRVADLVTITVDQRDADGRLLARDVHDAFTPALDSPQEYYNLVWPRNGVPSFDRETKYSLLRRQGGIDVVLAGMYFTDRLRPMGMIRGGVRTALTNMAPRVGYAELQDWPKTFDANFEKASANYPGWIGRYDPVTIHLQDERHSPRSLREGFAISDVAMAEFRAWLRGQYGEVAALNAEWGTAYASFDEATPQTDPQVIVQQPGSFAQWLDLLRWADLEICLKGDRKFIDLMDGDTQHRLAYGFEGVFAYNGGHLNPYSGLNVSAIFDSGVKMNNMAYGIGTPTWELCASLNPEADSGTWLGYESGPDAYRQEPWRGVLSGATFMGWFIDSLFIGPQGSTTPQLQWVEESTRPLRQGVGRMLNESTRSFDQVAILANNRSAQLAWMYGVQMSPATKGRDHHWLNRPLEDSGVAMLSICRDAGISPTYITEGQILGGRLDAMKVLIQTGELSVDDDVAKAIAAWVKKGGVLIADVGAGAYNEHGRRLETGNLDEVFGLRRVGGFDLVAEAGDFSVGLLNPPQELLRRGSGSGSWYMVEYFEPNLEATTAQACGQYVFGKPTPMCFWNRYGEGRALYLGFLLNRFRSDERDNVSPRPLLHAALAYAGVKPQVVLAGADGAQLPGFTLNHFQDGEVRYTGIIRRSVEAPSLVTLKLPEARHAYEVMTNRYLGFGADVPVDLSAAVASRAGMPTLNGAAVSSSQDTAFGMALIALLPYALDHVEVAAAASKPGDPLVVDVAVLTPDGPAAGRHVLYLDVRDPDGNAAEPYCQNIVVNGGKAQLRVPLAENERAGTWTLTVREPITGKTAATTVRIGDPL